MKPNIGQGDSGDTSLFGGRRVRKDDCQVDAYGDVDELNSTIGLIRSINTHHEIDMILEKIQNELFVLGSQLASDTDNPNSPRLDDSQVRALEENIQKFEKDLPELKHFILPTGGQLASLLHVSRAICRRAERRIVELADEKKVDGICIAYTNRLSDLLFTLARWANAMEGRQEKEWLSGRNVDGT